MSWILENERALIDAEFAINEGGGGALRNGPPFRLAVQLAEKVYQTYVLEVTDPGGHSASPRRDNPIYRLSAALTQARAVRFPAAAQCGDARKFRAAGQDRDAGDGGRDQGAARRLDRSAAARAALGQSDLQRADAHHLRRHAAGSRHGGERVAADRARHGELPHPAGRAGRGDRQDPYARHRRREGHDHAHRAGRWRRRRLRRIRR